MTTISLREWETARPDPGSPLAQLSLAAHPAGQRLAEDLTKSGRMEVLELARGLELRATSFVGRFSLGEVTVTVCPKISGAPLLNLFRYAYGLRHLDIYSSVDFAASPWSFQDLLVRQLVDEAGEILARGIHRDYERLSVDLTSPRGRIDFSRYVRTAHSGKTTLPCIHHPRTEDTVLNRVLLAGLGLAANVATDGQLKAHVRRLGKMLAASVATIPLDSQVVTQAWREMDRRTTAYKPSLTLIELLHGDQGIDLDERSASVPLSGFLFDMNRFFQALVSRFLREHLSGVDVHDEFRLKGVFSFEPGRNPCARRAPTLRPDFVVMRGGQVVAVLDAKYRDLWESSLPREMLYQLALYALGRPGIERTSAILYPTIAPAREQVIAIKEPIYGMAQARVALRPVNLLALDELLRDGSSTKKRERSRAFAHWLAFGGPSGQQ